VAVDIWATWFSGDEEADGCCLVVDCIMSVDGLTIRITQGSITERDDDPCIAELLVDSIDVLHIRPFDPGHAISILVLGLEGNHRPAIGNLRFCDDFANVVDVVLGRLQEAGLVCS
jgi:hypothetical protein